MPIYSSNHREPFGKTVAVVDEGVTGIEVGALDNFGSGRHCVLRSEWVGKGLERRWIQMLGLLGSACCLPCSSQLTFIGVLPGCLEKATVRLANYHLR
jgi:hypothetical protein